MKIVVLVVCFFISCTQAKGFVKDVEPSCYDNCVGFASYLKSRSFKDPVEEARKYCADFKIKCEDVLRFAKLASTYVQAGLSMAGVCRSKRFCTQPAKAKPVTGNVGCTVCKTIVNTISISIRAFNQTEKEIINAVSELCKILSPLKVQSKVCKDVLSYVDAIIQWVLNGLDPGDICVKLKLCNGTMGIHQSKAMKLIAELVPMLTKKIGQAQQDLPFMIARFSKWEQRNGKNGDSTSCTICKTVTNIMSYSIKFTNKTMEAVAETITAFCNKKPEHEREKCLVFVTKMDQIAAYIEQKFEPRDVCKKLGFCSETERDTVKTVNALVIKNANPTGKKSEEGCEICKTVVKIITYSIQFTNSTMEAVEESIKMFCNMKKEPEKSQCLLYVEKMDEIAKYIEQKLSPGYVCVKLGFCANTSKGRWYKPLKRPSKKHKKTMKSVCNACSAYETFVQRKLDLYQANSKKMREYIQLYCRNAADTVDEEKCLMLAPVLVATDGVANKLLDKGYCKRTMCSKAFLMAASTAERKKSSACNICKYSVDAMAKRFEFYSQMMKKYLFQTNNFCSRDRFKELTKQCNLYESQAEALFNNIGKEIRAASICDNMNLCRKKSRFSFESFWKSASQDLSVCGICKAAVGAAQREDSAAGVTKSVKMSCSHIQRFTGKTMCQKIIEHAEDVASGNKKKKSPAAICKKLQLCEGGFDLGRMIGGIVQNFQNMFG